MGRPLTRTLLAAAVLVLAGGAWGAAAPDRGAPPAPTRLQVTEATVSALALAWEQPHGKPAESWRVYADGELARTTAAPSVRLEPLACGRDYRVEVAAVDKQGRESERAAVAGRTARCPDTTPPSGPMLSLAEAEPDEHVSGATLYYNPRSTDGGTFTVEAQTDDAESGIGSVSFPDVFGADGGDDRSAPYSHTYWWTTGASVSGEQAVTAFNGDGLRSSAAFAVRPDAEGPVGGSVSYPDGFQALASVSVGFDPGADAGAGLDPGSVVLERRAAPLADGLCGAYGDWSPAASPDAATSGTCLRYRLHAADRVGNETVYATVNVLKADTTPPSAALHDPGAVLAGAVTLSATAGDAESGIDRVRYEFRPMGAEAWTATGATWDTTLVADGLYDLRVVAVDRAGNSTASAPLTGREVRNGMARLFVSPGGSDAAPCTRTAPCLSFGRAYRLAGPGQVVEVAGGGYGGQTIPVDASKGADGDVVFEPAPGADVVLSDEIVVHGSHVEFRDMTVSGWQALRGADDVTFRDVTVRGGIFVISASNVSVIGGSVGPGVNFDPLITSADAAAPPPRNILIDGVDFHDWTRTGDQHIECLQFGAGVNVTIRNSRFRNCETHDIFIRSWGEDYPLRNFVIENNFLGATRIGFNAIQFADDLAPEPTSFLVRNNSSLQPFLDWIRKGTITFSGNIVSGMTSYECSQSQSTRWRYNVVESGEACGSTDRVGPVYYRDRAALDLHLLPGSAALDAGDPTNSPPRDIDGEARPSGLAPDAGADESGGAPGTPVPVDMTPPAVRLTAPADGASLSGSAQLSAEASEAVAVRFLLDGAALGDEDVATPYSVGWDTRWTADGRHVLRAVARDAAGNTAVSDPVVVTVDNSSLPPDAEAGLVAAYSFDEGAGTVAVDGSGRGNSGTVSGASWVAGRIGGALAFDGVDDWVTIPDADSLDLRGALTLEAWVRPVATRDWATVLMKEQPGGQVYSLYANTDAQWGNGPSAHVFTLHDNFVPVRSTLPTGAWTHLAATSDGSTLRVYVNGVEAGSLAYTGTMPVSSAPFRIGGNSVWGEWFQGAIDEVRVYDRALSAGEIQAHASG